MKDLQLFLLPLLLLLSGSSAGASDAFLLREEGFELRFPFAYEELAAEEEDKTEKRNFVAGNAEDGVSFVFMFGEVDSKNLPQKKVLAIITEPTSSSHPLAVTTPLPSTEYIGAETISPLTRGMGPDGILTWYRKRVLIKGSTLYQLELFAQSREELSSARSNNFFESFKIRDGNETKQGEETSNSTSKP